MRRHPVIDHHADEDDGRNRQIDQAGGGGGGGDDEPGEVNLLDQGGVADHRVAGIGQGAGIVLPEQQPHIEKDRVGGRVAAGNAGHAVEDEGEDDHRDERLEDRPYDPQRGLLVAHSDVAPGQHQEKIPVPP